MNHFYFFITYEEMTQYAPLYPAGIVHKQVTVKS